MKIGKIKKIKKKFTKKKKLKAFYKMRKHYMMTCVNVFLGSHFVFLFIHFLAKKKNSKNK